MKMKTVVKMLEPIGFKTNVYESIIKKNGHTSCSKYFDGFTISVVAYNDGGFRIQKSHAYKNESGEIKYPAVMPIQSYWYSTLKELKENVLADIERLSK